MFQSPRKTRRRSPNGNSIVTEMLTIRNQIKVYHWQTKSFARHTATDGLTTKLDELVDEFVETYMGKYGRPSVSGTIKVSNFTEAGARAFVSQKRKYLEVDLPKKIKSTDTDLLNIRDEILGELNKVLYLFSLS
jgi:hypothetical protein